STISAAEFSATRRTALGKLGFIPQARAFGAKGLKFRARNTVLRVGVDHAKCAVACNGCAEGHSFAASRKRLPRLVAAQ
ncbi:MAG TPA: hypothetical protein VHW01_22130, partial [Polyangiaceae bacterium]|nr:hypothetical protein [Polyangiaceae bacterium]